MYKRQAIFVFNKNETLETKNGVLLQKVSFITLKVGNTNLTLQKINNNINENTPAVILAKDCNKAKSVKSISFLIKVKTSIV